MNYFHLTWRQFDVVRSLHGVYDFPLFSRLVFPDISQSPPNTSDANNRGPAVLGRLPSSRVLCDWQGSITACFLLNIGRE